MNIAIVGYGKMGKLIKVLAEERGHTVPIVITRDNSVEINSENFRNNKVDVVIEFTNPKSAFQNITNCFEAGVNVVSGSTGWLDQFPKAIESMQENGRGFIYASNFSIGVNILFEINRNLAELMHKQHQYEVEMTEIHHTQKLDAPSGTAVTLAEDIIKHLDRKEEWTLDTPKSNQIYIAAERKDPTPGTHSVKYSSDIDDLEIRHVAHNRNGFGLGAILAAEYIHGKKGLHKMRDVLGL